MPELKDEWRERVEDGEMIRIKAEDRSAALSLAARMEEQIASKPWLHVFLAVEILATSVVEEMAGQAWGKAVRDVFKQIPVEG